MTTAELLEKALALAAEGLIDAQWCADRAKSVKTGEGRIVIVQGLVDVYEEHKAAIVLDGTTEALSLATTAQKLLVNARRELRLYQDAVSFAVEALEMQILLAEHKKARARKEMHA